MLHAAERVFSPRIAWRHNTQTVLMASTGLRVNEAVQLRVGDIRSGSRVGREIYIRKSTQKGKPGGARLVLNDYARKWLDAWLHYSGLIASGDTAWLFPASHAGRSDTTVFYWDKPLTRHAYHQLFARLVGECCIDGKVTTHSLRKFYAESIRREAGGDILIVQQALRHRDIASTMRYVRADEAAVVKAMRGVL